MSKKALPNMANWTDRQIAEFWQTHDSADYWDDLEEVTEVVFEQRPKGTIAMRLDTDDLTKLKQLAIKQGVGYSTLVRMWVKEKLASVAP